LIVIARGFITDSVKVVHASTADWHGSTAAASNPQVVKFDTLGYSGALVLVNTGTAGETELTLTLTQGDTEAGAFTTVSETSVEPTNGGANYSGKLVVYDVADLSRRWLAVNAVKTGETQSVQIAVTVVLYGGSLSPVPTVANAAAGVFVNRVLNA
jgi:hypothetical protein